MPAAVTLTFGLDEIRMIFAAVRRLNTDLTRRLNATAKSAP
ncbi:hypothetical protein [Arthrobacter rhizosphaerae]|nr:hypothetical protein [Arthrobacter rhizosphaerae]